MYVADQNFMDDTRDFVRYITGDFIAHASLHICKSASSPKNAQPLIALGADIKGSITD